jgi:hypothetical protein
MRRSLKVDAALARKENQKLAHLFMICSNIKLTGPQESIELGIHKIHEQNQMDAFASSRPSTFFASGERKDVDARDKPGHDEE